MFQRTLLPARSAVSDIWISSICSKRLVFYVAAQQNDGQHSSSNSLENSEKFWRISQKRRDLWLRVRMKNINLTKKYTCYWRNFGKQRRNNIFFFKRFSQTSILVVFFVSKVNGHAWAFAHAYVLNKNKLSDLCRQQSPAIAALFELNRSEGSGRAFPEQQFPYPGKAWCAVYGKDWISTHQEKIMENRAKTSVCILCSLWAIWIAVNTKMRKAVLCRDDRDEEKYLALHLIVFSPYLTQDATGRILR